MRAVGHIFPAEHAQAKHLLRRQLGFEIGSKMFPHRFREFIAVPALHHVVYDDGLGSHIDQRMVAV